MVSPIRGALTLAGRQFERKSRSMSSDVAPNYGVRLFAGGCRDRHVSASAREHVTFPSLAALIAAHKEDLASALPSQTAYGFFARKISPFQGVANVESSS